MPIHFHLQIVPTRDGAMLFLRDGHGNFVPKSDQPFASYCKDDDSILKEVRTFLKWERNTR